MYLGMVSPLSSVVRICLGMQVVKATPGGNWGVGEACAQESDVRLCFSDFVGSNPIPKHSGNI